MKELFKEISMTNRDLTLQLLCPEKLEKEMFDRMHSDEYCLSCVLEDEKSATIRYSISHLVCLEDFMKQYIFEKEEGYYFLENVLERAIATNRNKPILYDARYIFLSEHGEAVYFVVLPVLVDQWMAQKENIRDFVNYLCTNIQTNTTFEIPGFLLRFLDSPEFSLPNLILGLKNIQKLYYPAKFSFFKRRKETTFYCKEPIHPLYQIQQPSIPEAIGEKTMLLGMEFRNCAYLIKADVRYDLISEEMIVGRSMACDIRLDDTSISLKHARITCEESRFYVQDLKSTNGTYLEGKKVQRKMRLKDGMHISFANCTFEFHQ
ncbi:MAG: FHA domain-containing protein [Holdemanella sp.]|nr:FHA domain-containing protein [Holdemanella sp.]